MTTRGDEGVAGVALHSQISLRHVGRGIALRRARASANKLPFVLRRRCVWSGSKMAEETQSSAWLEQTNIGRVEIRGTCSIGRAPSNQVVLPDDKVSRRHAVIHAQDVDEFWLVDLGSSNGTYLNGRRVSQPSRLWDQDRIEIGPFRVVFRQPQAARVSTPEQTDVE